MGRLSCRNALMTAVMMTFLLVLVNRARVTPDASTGYACRNTSLPNNKDAEMKARTLRMKQICSQYPIRRQLKTYLKGKLFYVSEKYKLSYCRVAKVGSTFWTQVFLTLAGISRPKTDGKTLFDVPRDETHEEMKRHKQLTMSMNDKRLPSTTSFMVTRNPYSRLFSSYIDQIFLPNKWYLAKSMTSSVKQSKCGNNVSFEEFLKYISKGIIRNSYQTDLHWAPIFSICEPCKINMDIIAKQETFKEDADYILNRVGVEQSIRDQVEDAIGGELIEHSLGTLVHTYVTKGQSVSTGCISESQLAERLWTAFKIQGYIHNDARYPEETFAEIKKTEIESVLLNEVLNAVSERKLTSSERAAQRHAWMVKYWNGISQDTVQLVQDAYYEDFYVFDYNIEPSSM